MYSREGVPPLPMHFPRSFFHSICFLRFALVLLGGNAVAQTYTPPSTTRATLNFNADWIYFQGDATNAQTVGFDDSGWTPVGLPHATALVTQNNTEPYIGVSWYRKHFMVGAAYQGSKVFLQFGAAMQSANVWVNGTQVITQHVGGYTPFTADVTSLLNYGGGDNVVAVRLDSDSSSNWAPGWAGVDFRYYGGLYRDVFMVVTNPLHVTDPVYANKTASGGIFVTYPSVSTAAATVNAQTDVLNESSVAKNVTVVSTLVDAAGNMVQSATTTISLAAGAESSVSQNLPVSNPHLWHPYTPYLYTLNTVIQDGATSVDYVKTTVGIRQIQWLHNGGFLINGSQFVAHGADYHQDVYLLGNAMPATAIYQDVKRMKDAGLDFVRCSHYPHNPAFYDACDQLGMLVMDSITGWQYYNDATTFQNNTFQECRDLIHRDRNHPSVVLWETSLNESNYTTAWASTINALAHAEYPGNQMYTTGWATTVFDTYCASSQSGVRSSTDPRPIIIDEYGSWDFGGANTTSAVAREGTEGALLQQCTNFTQSENSNLGLSWFSADAVWVFGDYAGYTNYTVSTLGMVDWTRLPKFSYYFYKSQRDPTVSIPNVDSGPMVYIANYYQPTSPTTVRVFSNCQQVSLYQNNVLVATQTPDKNYPSLPHPPFTFNLSSYVPGTLRADGQINGVTVATTSRSTAGPSAQIVLTPDGTTSMNADGGDSRLVFISVEDANGQVVPTSTDTITLAATGQGQVVGPTAIQMRAGQMATWVRAGRIPGTITLTATGPGLTSATANFTTVAVPGLNPLLPPASPTGLTGSASGAAQVTLSWTDNSSNESSFVVEHSLDDITFTPVMSVPANSTTASFVETAATIGTYYYQVVAQNAAGNSSPSNVLPLKVNINASASAWTYADIGAVGATGLLKVSSASGSSVLSMSASGADIWNTADAFGYYYVQRIGDFQIVARVTSVQNTNTHAKAGVMIRNSLAADSQHALIDVLPASGGTEFITRTTEGASAQATSGSGSAPLWVSLVRSGNTFTGSTSTDGINWTPVSSATIAMNASVYLGLAVTSHDQGTLCTGTFDHVSIIQNGWTATDIGAVNVPGDGQVINASGATSASGADIWGTADAFHYVYQQQTGNFALRAQITGVSNTSASAKAGLMIRNTLAPGSAHALVDLTPGNVAEFIWRSTASASASSSTIANETPPEWIRLVCVGDTFRSYVSADAVTWTQIGSAVSIPMNSGVYFGLAATSHNAGALSSGIYEGLTLELPGQLSFGAPTASVSETGGSATITVNRLNGSIGPVTVNYATTTGGTAVAGTNYVSTSGTLSWADADTAPKTFTVPILNDNVSGPNRTIVLALSSPGGGATLGIASTLLTIVENPTQNWRYAHFGANANNPAISGDTADPDGDGVCNLIEYALACDPNSGTSIPALQFKRVPGGYQLSFPRNATANDVTIILQSSPDLNQWNTAMTYTAANGWIATAPNATAVETSLTGTGVDQSVGVTLTVPDLSAGATRQLFFRLDVTRP